MHFFLFFAFISIIQIISIHKFLLFVKINGGLIKIVLILAINIVFEKMQIIFISLMIFFIFATLNILLTATFFKLRAAKYYIVDFSLRFIMFIFHLITFIVKIQAHTFFFRILIFLKHEFYKAKFP